jgi:hypothetical protein
MGPNEAGGEGDIADQAHHLADRGKPPSGAFRLEDQFHAGVGQGVEAGLGDDANRVRILHTPDLRARGGEFIGQDEAE